MTAPPTYALTRVAPGLVPRESYPPATRGEVVVWGLLASYPFGGMTWQVLHHLVGLRRLGFDVWYVEDLDDPVFDVTTYWQTSDVPEHNVRYLADAMAAVGLSNRYIFRHPESRRCSGAGDLADLRALYRRARAVFNVCAANPLCAEHEEIRNLVYLETDPGWSQVSLARGHPELSETVSRHHHHFTYGTNVGTDACVLPTAGYDWHPTRPPVVVEWWAAGGATVLRAALTTIANWRHGGKDVEWAGVSYQWRKDVAFEPYLDLPARAALPLELMLGAISGEERDALRARGWRVGDSVTIADPGAYRDYILSSLGEFSVSKEQYTRTGSGWFSDRSVCYLAAGLPVILEDTGLTGVSEGEGLLFFRSPAEALTAIDAVAENPAVHRKAARQIAQEHFAAEVVLADVARLAGLMD